MGPRIGESWLVQHGLKAGDRVVVDGVQRLKPGIPVKGRDYVAAPAAPPPAMAPAATGR
jgi:membrane fusion protein (multidrug efflux system)